MLSFQEKLERNIPIYVKNMTREPPATVCVTFKHHGDTYEVYIPPSNLPFKLSGKVGKSMLREGGQELGQLLSSGTLRLVNAKKAKKVLSDEEASEESRLQWEIANNPALANRRISHAASSTSGDHPANPTVDEDGNPYVRGPRFIDPTKLPDKKPMEALQQRLQDTEEGSFSRSQYQLALSTTDPSITPRVLGVMATWSIHTDESTLRSLKASASYLQTRDFHYIMGACQRNCRTYKWAQSKLNRIV